MVKLISFSILAFYAFSIFSQAKVDLDRSVPLWMEYDSVINQAKLKWIGDGNASTYYISEVSPTFDLTAIDTLNGASTEFPLGTLENGTKYRFHIKKDQSGRGIITLGLEIPIVHQRGRCLIAIDDLLVEPLALELSQIIQDIEMDGWEVDTMHISRSNKVDSVKSKISGWYISDYELSQSLFLLGHIPVPYSGNSAHDGHGNHAGAWAADAYYGELNGNWTDVSVNNITPSREANKNIPGDGKYDQTVLPSKLEIEIGRVDFHDLPEFEDGEIELTRQYLEKNHEFRIGNKEYPRRALIENNFGSFAEGFGQSGWRNFTTMFGGDSVSIQDYNKELEDNKYLFSYACGGGSYTSCGGVGTTKNLWVAKDIKTVFTLNFGSYFGDWDSKNNFMRSALASGDVLTNAWAGRPVWHLYDMSLGMHIGYSAKLTQNALGNFFNPGSGVFSAHIALMGDPTLRLHAMKRPDKLQATTTEGNIQLSWNPSPEASHGHIIYRRTENSKWEYIAEVNNENSFVDSCMISNTTYSYLVKALKLEQTGSGSYFNTSLGIGTSIESGDNANQMTYYADADMDGYGNIDNSTTSCSLPTGFVDNNLDCDDTNFEINPDAIDIPNNNIDEDCNGEDLLVGIDEELVSKIEIFPNPTLGIIQLEGGESDELIYRLYSVRGVLVKSGVVKKSIDISNEVDGMYWLELRSMDGKAEHSELIILLK